AFAAFIAIGLPAGLLGVAWPSIRGEFALSQDGIAALLMTSQIGYIISSFLSGQLATRYGMGELLLLGSVAGVVGLLGYALAPTWFPMVAIGFFAGFGGGAVD